MTERKLVYIASPYAGEVAANVEFARAACRYCIEWGHTPIAVHLLYPQILDDSDPTQRETALALGRHVLEHCDEVWMCGSQTSAGMRAELELAESLGIPVSFHRHDQILAQPAPIYAIWAKGRPDGPLTGQSGFLCENRKRMFFSSTAEAEARIGDIRNLCLNNRPAAELKCLEYSPDYASGLRVHLETLRDLDMIPSFDPNNFEIRSQAYGNTGGGYMVGVVQCYLPDLDKSVWVNCNNEGVSIASADSTWNEDNSDSWERWEDVILYNAEFGHRLPDDAEPWLPMIKKALEYIIGQEVTQAHLVFELPVAWLPESLAQNTDMEYLDWLKAEKKKISITKEGRILIDEAYSGCSQNQLGIGAMEQQ